MTKICLPISEGYWIIQPNEISSIKSENIYSYVYNGIEKHFVSRSLKDMESLLPTDEFYRCHKSYMVNLSKIAKVITAGNSHLVMKNGLKVPVSRAKKKELLGLIMTMHQS